MCDSNCFVVLFGSTHQALSAERVLKSAGIKHAVINTPRELSVDCGISLRVESSLADQARRALDAGGIVYEGIEPYSSRWI